MVYFDHMRRTLLVGTTLIVLTSAFAAAQVRVGSGQTPKTLREADRGGLAPQFCQENRESYDRLSGLLQKVRNNKTNQDAIKRAQALIRGSKADSLKADEKAQKLFSDAAMAEINNLAEALPGVEDLVQKALKRDFDKYEKAFLESAEKFKDIADNLEKLQKAAKAGAKFGTDIQKTNGDLHQNIAKVKELLKESGILEEIPTVEDFLTDSGEKLAVLLLGPVGGLAFRAANFSINYIAATEEGFISDSVRNQAVLHLERLHSSEENIWAHLDDIKKILVKCDRAEKRDQQEDTQQANVSSEEGGGSNAALIALGVGAAGAAGAAAYVASQNIGSEGSGLSCDSGYRFCSGNVCCPIDKPAICSNGTTCTTIFFSSCPGGGIATGCCPGPTDCFSGQ